MDAKILIVDDDTDYCRVLRVLLERRGYTVLERHDPAAGLTALLGVRPDVVILDVLMPRGGGRLFFETARRDERFRRLPIVVVTGWEADESVFERLGSQPDPHTLVLRKPFEPERLDGLLRSFLR